MNFCLPLFPPLYELGTRYSNAYETIWLFMTVYHKKEPEKGAEPDQNMTLS